MMNTLYLVRHAKSSWNDSSLSDQQRSLNKRGLSNAPEMGRRLQMSDARVDLIVSSPANRALTTARLLAQEIGYDIERIQQNDHLYFSSTGTMLDLIRDTDSAIHYLMLVGHNPHMTSLLNRLCESPVVNMPTCAIATIQFDQEWSKLSDHSGRLADYDYPKRIVSRAI